MTRRRSLSDEEKTLWRKVTKDIKPARHDGDVDDAPLFNKTPIDKLNPPIDVSRQALKSSVAVPYVPRTMPPAFGAGDPAVDRRVARGKLPIDRVLDLHGDTRAAAQIRLQRFITDAYRDECYCVLVITGKGGAASASSMAQRRSPESDFKHATKGVLRAAFLEWVEGPDLRGMISRVSKARPKDGGDGAFYIFLRRKEK